MWQGDCNYQVKPELREKIYNEEEYELEKTDEENFYINKQEEL